MSWLAPLMLGAAGLAAAAVALLHLLARDRPQRWMLPTARFVPAGSAQATRRARRPRDLALLALRVLALLFAGAAFAGPVLVRGGGRVAHIVALDRPAARTTPALVDSARVRMHAGARLLLFDTAATVVAAGAESPALDALSMRTDPVAGATRAALLESRLSPMLVAARRLAVALADAADSVALTVITSEPVGDAATSAIRREWPGRVAVVRVVVPDTTMRTWRRSVRGPASDPLVAAARLAGARLIGAGEEPPAGALVVRTTPTAQDSTWAARGNTLLAWPEATGEGDLAAGDSVGGFVAAGVTVLFDARRTAAPPAGAAIARWIDGRPAASERAHGSGCIRTAAVPLPTVGDLTLGAPFREALAALTVPCGAVGRGPAADSTTLAMLAGTGGPAPAASLRRAADRAPATPWLLAVALAMLLAEPLLRRRRDAAAGGRG